MMRVAGLVLGGLLLLATAGMAQEVPPAVMGEAPVQGLAPGIEVAPVLPGAEPPGVVAPVADLSPMGMVRAAHPVVQGVMGLLALATLACWTVLVFKSVEIGLARARARRSCRALIAAPTLEAAARSLAGAGDPAALMARAAEEEMQRSGPVVDRAGPDGVKERVRSLLVRVEAGASARLRRGTGLLATIGAVAPFVGLFGTVWGIMNAFVGIAETRTTNLSVVAPGIAEALLATAIGLVAAIPAVVIYNHFSRSITGYRQVLGDAAAAVERLVSRDLDIRAAAPRPAEPRPPGRLAAVGEG